MRKRLEGVPHRYHEDRISAKGINSLSRYNLVQKSIPMPLDLHGPTTWKVMQRNVWKDIANLRIKVLNNYTKSQHHAWMIINFGEEENESVGELSTVCSQIVLKMSIFGTYRET